MGSKKGTEVQTNSNSQKEERFNPLNSIAHFFNLIYLGAREIIYFIIDIFVYAWRGFKSIFIDTLAHLYYASSSGVDKAYRGTKKVLGADNTDATQQQARRRSRRRKVSILEKIEDLLGITKMRLKKLEQEKRVLQQELVGEDAKRLSKPTVYRYTAKDPKGKIVSGCFTGFSKLDVNTFLVNEGYDVFKIETGKWINFVYGESGVLAKKMSNKDLIFWLTQLSTYVKSGIPLTDAVRILGNQMGKSSGRKRVFDTIVYELTMGTAFSEALEKQGSLFPPLLINMLKAAEATGELAETLDDMANYYQETETTRKQMISAMTYPAIITVFALAVVTFIIVYVVPQFTQIFNSLGSDINGLTLFIVMLSNNLKSNLVLYIIVIVVLIVLFYIAYKNIKAFRKTVQVALMHIPVVGNMIIYSEMAIFSKTFSSLLKNNVFITDSMDILSKITNNEVYKEIMFDTISNIAVGGKISETFADHWAVPDVAYYMIVTGESTGELASMMNTVSRYYQEQHSMLVNSLKSFIEPLMIALLAVMVGVIVMSVVMPMFDLYSKISM